MKQSLFQFFLKLLLISLVVTPFNASANDEAHPNEKWWKKKVDRSIANEIKKAYPNNLSQLKKTSANSEYALLAWASISQDGRDIAKQMGWITVKCDICLSNDFNVSFNVFGNQNTRQAAIVFNHNSAAEILGSPMHVAVEGAKKLTSVLTDKFSDTVFIGYQRVGGALAEQCSLAKDHKAVTFDAIPIMKDNEPIKLNTLRFISDKDLYEHVSKNAFAIEIKNITGPIAKRNVNKNEQDKKLGLSEELRKAFDLRNEGYENQIELIVRDMLTIDLAYKNGWLK